MRQFHEAMSDVPALELTPNLLTSARMQLQESLETVGQRHGWQRFFFDPLAFLRPARFSPALATIIFIVGFGGGIGTMYQMARNTMVPINQKEIHDPTSASMTSIRSISQQPGTNNVQIDYDTTVPQKTQGSIDNPDIQNMLLLAARTNYNSGVRMDSIDLLKQKPDDGRVREGLVFSLRYDSNPGVRLKALEALQGQVKQDIRVRNAMLEALLNDNNPGVRTGALKALEQVKGDTSVRQALQQLSKEDPNQYIRQESARVLNSLPDLD
jgi:hypothetical protein